MKAKFILLTVAAISMFGMATAPAFSAADTNASGSTASSGTSGGGGIGHFDCTEGDSYDVKKGMCIPTTGAAAYSPHMFVDKDWASKHDKQIIQ
ncbi:MAG: hypothetical protein M3O03_03305 [Pseudomonadota bacterium]|nr:hypothetical protein [Pseudomonadota bacterium]